jgi:hypothetical protein
MNETDTVCAGYRRYSRNPDKLGPLWICDEPVYRDGRCMACESEDNKARLREREDDLARARVRAVLAEAVAPLRDEYPILAASGSYSNRQVRDLMADIVSAVKATGNAGGSGDYWLALRVFVGLA